MEVWIVIMGMQETKACILLDGPVRPDFKFGPVTKRIQNMVIVVEGQSRKTLWKFAAIRSRRVDSAGTLSIVVVRASHMAN